MTQHAPTARMTEAQYLAWEECQVEKHEFVNGEIVAMAGVSPAHDRIVINLIVGLTGRMRGGPCRLTSSDIRVRIDETGLYAYPDLTIHCGHAAYAPTRPVCLLNPRVVIEVLSENTAGYDLGAKAAHYRHRATIQTLLFVDSRKRSIQRQDRNVDGTWTLADLESGDVRVLDVVIPFDEVYDEVELEDEGRTPIAAT